MEIAIIAALADNNVIGRDNQLPWHLPADLRHFRQLTLGKPILMGRRTYESIGKPLPGRLNIVLTRRPDFHPDGVCVVGSFEEGLARAEAEGAAQCMVIGGADIYMQALPLASRLYLTHVHAEVEGDARFPEVPQGEWRQVDRATFPAEEGQPYAYSIAEYARST